MKVQKLPHDITTYEAAHHYLEQHPRPGLFILQLCHDDWCLTLQTGRGADCKPPCHPDVWLIEPFGDARDN